MKFITYKQYVEYIKSNNILQLSEEPEEYELESKYDKKKVQEIDKKHDKMFRNVLSIKKEMAKFINQFLNVKEKIEEDEIVQCKTDFITTNYRNRQADIIYKIKEKPVYFLVEHQSVIDKDMILRIWEYVGEIIRRESIIQKTYLEEESIYPIVIPIVIYTGNKKWNAKENMKYKQYQSKIYKENEIDFQYNLIEVQKYTFEELMEKNSLFGNIMIIEKCKTREEIEKMMDKIVEKIENKSEREIMGEIIKNIIEPSIGKEKAEELLEKLEREEETKMSPFTKCLLDLEIQYKEEGIKEGKLESLISIANKMLQRKMKISDIEEITGLKKEQIEKLAKENT